jgi:primase-polymerase (primpol)-like protein
MNPPCLPKSLAELTRFLLWDAEFTTEGKARKVPYRLDGRRRASTTDPRDWGSFEDACKAWRQRPWFSGLGFVFHHMDGLVGLDLDGCLDKAGAPKEWIQPVLQRFYDTYCERSVGGEGLHVFAKGRLEKAIVAPVADGQIEMYSTGRFFCLTGDRWRDCPLEVEDHREDVRELFQRLSRPSGVSYETNGNWSVNPDSNGTIPEGQRHPFLVSLAGTLRRRHLLPNIIEATLHMVNREMCQPPKPDEEVSRIARDALKWQ